MATYVFINISAQGHINPTLPIVAELAQRGHRVYYLTGQSSHQLIQNCGGIPIVIPGTQQRQGPAPGDKELALLPFVIARDAQHIVPQIVELLRQLKPDVLICNTLLLWGRLAAQILSLPIIGFRPFHALRKPRVVDGPFDDPRLAALAKTAELSLSSLATAYHLPVLTLRELLEQVEKLTLVFMPKAFQADAEQFDDRFLFAGPSFREPSSVPWPLLNDDKRETIKVYISLGTLRNNQPDFYRKCFSAFSDPKWSVLISAGEVTDLEELGTIPDNFLVRRSVPQTAILRHVDVFVTHGGLNSTMESLYYGVPLVVLPSIREQRVTGNRVEALNLGAVLEPDSLTADALGDATEKVWKNETIKKSVSEMQKHIREAGGYERAANAIISFTD